MTTRPRRCPRTRKLTPTPEGLLTKLASQIIMQLSPPAGEGYLQEGASIPDLAEDLRATEHAVHAAIAKVRNRFGLTVYNHEGEIHGVRVVVHTYSLPAGKMGETARKRAQEVLKS